MSITIDNTNNQLNDLVILREEFEKEKAQNRTEISELKKEITELNILIRHLLSKNNDYRSDFRQSIINSYTISSPNTLKNIPIRN